MVVASVSVLWVVVAIVVSYAAGTVPGATIVARRHGVNLRETGDGNPGSWNALEQLGWARAWPAFLTDGLKGLVAAAAGWAALGAWPDSHEAYALTSWLPWGCVGAAMLGHAFPVPHPGRGGKSLMTFCGGVLGLVPVVGAPLVAVWIGGILAGRARAVSIVVVFAFPFAQALVTPLLQVGWTGILMTGVGALMLGRRRPSRAAP